MNREYSAESGQPHAAGFASPPLAAETMASLFSALTAGGISVKLRGFSALDLYLGLPPLPVIWAESNADIAILARYIENLRYPGIEIADGAADTPEGTCYFTCLDSDELKQNNYSFPLLSFSYDPQSRSFRDPLGLYPLLREIRAGKNQLMEERDVLTGQEFLRRTEPEAPGNTFLVPQEEAGWRRVIMDGALLLSRYSLGSGEARFIADLAGIRRNSPAEAAPGPEAQRAFLSCLLVSPRPDRGLDLLKRSGLLEELWPELACLDNVDHSKEYHPEGNAWNHTLETFRHRKAGANGSFDLRLSLGLLLHDAGKPISAANGNHRFDGHAELGARAASRFLERLGFDPSIVRDIFYLVKNHMLPAALKRLSYSKTGEIMASPLFPTLMELYRCDESSSFKGLDGYYENSAAYQAYLKNVRNPYRSADGKKMGKREMLRTGPLTIK